MSNETHLNGGWWDAFMNTEGTEDKIGGGMTSSAAAYGVSLAAVAVAVVARLMLDPLLTDRLPFITLFLAVGFAAWYGGRGPALLALVAGAVAAAFFLMQPHYSFAIDQTEYQVGLVLYGVVGFASIAMFESLRKAQRQSEERQRQFEQEVAARRLTEQAFAEQAERLRTTLASIGDAVITTDLEGRITIMNAVAESLTGWTTAEAMGQLLDAVFRIVNETTRKTVENPAFRALKEGVIVGLANHTVLIAKDGTERPIDDSAAPIRCKDGEILGCVLCFRDITERKRSEAEFQRVSGLLDTLLHTAPIGFCFLDRDLRYLRVNERLAEINGVSPEAHLGRPVSEIVPALVETIRNVTDHILATGEAVLNHEFSGEISAAPGVIRFWNESWYPVRDNAGEVVGFGGIVEEITARKQAEDALGESQQFISRVLDDGLSVFVGVTTPNGTVTYANRSALEAAGIPASEVLGKKFWDCYWWSYSPEIQAQLRDACERAARGEIVRYDVPVRMAGDTRMWIDFQVAPLRDTQGRITHLIPSAMDIAVRRAAEEKLRDSETRTRLATEATAVGIWEWNVVTNVTHWDAQMFLLYGIPPTVDGFVQYSDWSGAVLPEDLPEIERILQDTVRRGGQSRREFRIRRRDDGAVRHIESVETVRANAQGETEWVVGTHLDVTERKTAEIQLRQFAASLSEADRRKDEFLATLAHELRNPLAPIRTGLHVLQRSDDLALTLRTQAIMSRQLDHMVKLIDDLLDVSRISSGKVILRRERVSLRAVVESAVEASGSLLESAQHSLRIDLPGEPIWLDVDATRICQVFSNVLTNAAKYSPNQSNILLSGRQEGQDVVVCVVDPGVGIPADMLDHVFEMFAQVNRTLDRAQGGLGIGLALAKRLVEMHGGTIAAASAGSDQGSTFTVRLPAAVLAQDVAASTSRDGSKAARTDQLRVLIVDDNADAAESLAALFQLLGHETSVATSGPAGLELASRATPDVVFLDLGMPDMSGYEVARRLRPMPEFAATTLVALSGWGSDEDRRKAKEAGFDRHFVKPADYEEIEALLDQLGRRLGRIKSGQTSN